MPNISKIETPDGTTYDIRDPSKSSVSVSQITSTGTNIADITVDGATTHLYAPSGGGGGITWEDIYPVGAIYMSANSTSPEVLFGGEWEEIHGKFLFAEGTIGSISTGTKDIAAGTSGGSHIVPLYTHTHTVDITSKGMSANSSHSHGPGGSDATHFMYRNSNSGSQTRSAVGTSGSAYTWRGTTAGGFNSSTTTESKSLAHTHEVEGNTGGSSTFSSAIPNPRTGDMMPPYLAVYVWQRTA